MDNSAHLIPGRRTPRPATCSISIVPPRVSSRTGIQRADPPNWRGSQQLALVNRRSLIWAFCVVTCRVDEPPRFKRHTISVQRGKVMPDSGWFQCWFS